MVSIIINIVGYIGMVLVLVVYGLQARGILDAKAPKSLKLNLLSGTMLTVVTIYQHAWQSAFINIAWAIIAISNLVSKRHETSR
jgi:hypothetical protein